MVRCADCTNFNPKTGLCETLNIHLYSTEEYVDVPCKGYVEREKKGETATEQKDGTCKQSCPQEEYS